ncbi:hypothetical protein XENOCAPTIV_014074 [Xenoophorus captivus]|uniref:Uncharacterized protein n=1 Tax=Xenoophorus captivus TaxID=1517983 RepID=A0ABV0R1Q4_9TELE
MLALVLYLGSLSCWKVNLHLSLKSFTDSNRLSSKIAKFAVSPTWLLANCKRDFLWFSFNNGFLPPIDQLYALRLFCCLKWFKTLTAYRRPSPNPEQNPRLANQLKGFYLQV